MRLLFLLPLLLSGCGSEVAESEELPPITEETSDSEASEPIVIETVTTSELQMVDKDDLYDYHNDPLVRIKVCNVITKCWDVDPVGGKVCSLKWDCPSGW